MNAEKRRKITMAGEKMEVLFGVDCLWHSTRNIRLALPSIVRQLCKVLASENIADCLINEVMIGSTVVLIDKETDRTYRLEMQKNTICVLGIYEETIADSREISVVYMPNGRLLHVAPRRILEAA